MRAQTNEIIRHRDTILSRNWHLGSMSANRMIKLIIPCVLLLELVFSIAGFAAEPTREYKIKAGFLYKFLSFAEWPEDAFADDNTTIIIGIVGEDPFAGIFEKVVGQPVDGRRLAVKRFKKNATAEMLQQCHLLFIDPSLKKPGMKDLLEALGSYPVLTVSEMNEFIHLGGMINLVTKKNKVTFNINRAAAGLVGIKFRSRLLRLATHVTDGNNAD